MPRQPATTDDAALAIRRGWRTELREFIRAALVPAPGYCTLVSAHDIPTMPHIRDGVREFERLENWGLAAGLWRQWLEPSGLRLACPGGRLPQSRPVLAVHYRTMALAGWRDAQPRTQRMPFGVRGWGDWGVEVKPRGWVGFCEAAQAEFGCVPMIGTAGQRYILERLPWH